MAVYRKISNPIEAVQLLPEPKQGDVFDSVPHWVAGGIVNGLIKPIFNQEQQGCEVQVYTGEFVHIKPGDYILCNAEGQLHTMSKEQFLISYERVEL